MDKNILVQILLIISIFSCNKDNEFEYALIQTGDVTSIDNTGSTFHARVSDLSNANILEYGFVWNTESNPELHNSEKLIISGSPSIRIFSERISTTLEENVTYFVRAFIRNTYYTTYGKEVAFTSLGSIAPEILDFFPKTGNINDTLHIFGKNFSYKRSKNIVSIGKFPANVLKAVQDTLTVLVPDKLNMQSSLVRVSILGNEANYKESFNLISPVVNDFNEKIGTFGSLISITGNNFLSDINSLRVYFDKYEAEISEVQNEKLIVVVPDSLDKRQCNIYLEMNNLKVSLIDVFTLRAISIIDFTPREAHTGEIVKLSGNNFSSVLSDNIVTIGGLIAEVIASSIHELEVVIPLQDKGIYPGRDVNISVELFGESKSYTETLHINDKWFRLDDFPGLTTYDLDYFIVEDKLYLGPIQTRWSDEEEFWCFEPQNQSWRKLTLFPGEKRDNAMGFYLDGNIYYGTGSNYEGENLRDFWQYNILADKWIRKNDFPGEGRHGASGFAINNKGYLSSGIEYAVGWYPSPFADCWEYDANNDTWEEFTSYIDPLFESRTSRDGIAFGSVIVTDELAYFGLGGGILQDEQSAIVFTFDVSSGYTWNQIESFPLRRYYGRPISFEYNNMPYFGPKKDEIYFYNPDSYKWEYFQTDILTNYEDGIGFNISEKIYIGLGRSNALWIFDPTR